MKISIPSHEHNFFEKKVQISDSLVLDPENFTYSRILGKGATGKVRKCFENTAATLDDGDSIVMVHQTG